MATGDGKPITLTEEYRKCLGCNWSGSRQEFCGTGILCREQAAGRSVDGLDLKAELPHESTGRRIRFSGFARSALETIHPCLRAVSIRVPAPRGSEPPPDPAAAGHFPVHPGIRRFLSASLFVGGTDGFRVNRKIPSRWSRRRRAGSQPLRFPRLFPVPDSGGGRAPCPAAATFPSYSRPVRSVVSADSGATARPAPLTPCTAPWSDLFICPAHSFP